MHALEKVSSKTHDKIKWNTLTLQCNFYLLETR
jgi:hypothetical protein